MRLIHPIAYPESTKPYSDEERGATGSTPAGESNMEKTFNLKQHMTKTANLDYEGGRGYFLAQQRAWMNCSKCKRVEGKSAQEAWQECFDEFQEGDRKLSWIEAYAEEELAKVKKESAVDYSEDVVKLASSGMAIGGAVTNVLQERLAWKWPWQKDQKAPAQTAKPGAPAAQPNAEAIAINEQRKQQTQQNRAANPVNEQGFTQDQIAKNEARKKSVLQRHNNTKTYNALDQINKLVSQDQFDSDAIRQIILGIPDAGVKEQLGKYIQYLKRVEQTFHGKIKEMSALAQTLMKQYMDSGRKMFTAPAAPQGLAAASDSPVKTAQDEHMVLRRFASNRWVYYGEQDGVPFGADLTSAHRFAKEAADQKVTKLAANGMHYVPVSDDESDWSKE